MSHGIILHAQSSYVSHSFFVCVFKRLYPSASSLHCQDSRDRNINRAVFPLRRPEMSSHICDLKLSKIVNFLQKYLSPNSKAALIHPNNFILHIAQLGVPGFWSLHKVRTVHFYFAIFCCTQ